MGRSQDLFAPTGHVCWEGGWHHSKDLPTHESHAHHRSAQHRRYVVDGQLKESHLRGCLETTCGDTSGAKVKAVRGKRARLVFDGVPAASFQKRRLPSSCRCEGNSTEIEEWDAYGPTGVRRESKSEKRAAVRASGRRYLVVQTPPQHRRTATQMTCHYQNEVGTWLYSWLGVSVVSGAEGGQ